MISLHYPIALLLFAIGIYCLIFRRNLIKMIIGLMVLTDGIHLFLISLGYRAGGGPPIWTPGLSFAEFAAGAVDPIPQVLVLTSIVIDICIVAFALSLAIYIYNEYGTLNPADIRGLKE